MASDVGTHPFDDTSHLSYSQNDASEWERLDDLSKGIDAYLDHKLSLGPAVQNVKKILEIGCGSGAWAIQAAQTYPEAIVTAIDISPIPPRPLPLNMQFLQLDATESLPFEPESFDIIHARFVFVHLPNWKKVLKNVISLLKPLGWLWIEDIDIHFYDDGSQGFGSYTSLRVFNEKYLSFSKSRSTDPFAGSSLGPALRELEFLVGFLCSSLDIPNHYSLTSEINDVGIRCHANGKDDDPRSRSMGQVVYTAARRSLASSNIKWIAAGIPSELRERVFREAEDPLQRIYLQVHMTWSQKK